MKSEEKYAILYNEKMSTSAVTFSKENGSFGADIRCSPYRGALTEKDILFSRETTSSTSRYELEKELIRAVGSNSSVVFGLNGLCYPPQEAVFRLTERALEIMYDLKKPITVVTKSDMVLRDAGLIATIAGRSGATVVIPIFCEDNVSPVFEQGVPLPSFRFEMINRLASSGIRCGVMISPVVPYCTDSASGLRRLVKKAAESGAKFIVCDLGLQLSDEQKPLFKTVLDLYYPDFMRFYGTFSGNLFSVPRKKFVAEAIEEECKLNNLELILQNVL